MREISSINEISSLTCPLILRVNASAGSGKTECLSNWFIKLYLDNNKDLNSILAITFTNAATCEMQERIMDNLKKRALTENNKSCVTDDPVIEKITYLIRNYSDFNIKTIDSFITTILKLSALELNISANHNIDTKQNSYINESVLEFLSAFGKDRVTTDIINKYISYKLSHDKNTGWKINFTVEELFKSLRKYETNNVRELQLFDNNKYDEVAQKLKFTMNKFLQYTEKENKTDFYNNHFINFLKKNDHPQDTLKNQL